MESFDDIAFAPEEFSGQVRLFPLPNLVLFPHVMQPLHIFEPRYRALMEDALAGDQLITMALLEPGWEPHYEQRPPIAPIACLGKVVRHHRLADGRFNLLLLGLQRVRIVRELPPDRRFREAEVSLENDVYPQSGAAERPRRQRQLIDLFRTIASKLPQVDESLEQLLNDPPPLGVLTDVVSFAVELELAVKRQLLHETNVDRRAEMLLEALDPTCCEERSTPGFPPKFSDN